MKLKTIDIESFEEAFGEKTSEFVRDKILSYDFSYQEVSKDEKEKLVLSIIKKIDSGLSRSGEHRLNEWNKGWAENRDQLEKDLSFESLIPKYFGKLPYVRWKQEFIKPASNNFEYNMVQTLQYWLFESFSLLLSQYMNLVAELRIIYLGLLKQIPMQKYGAWTGLHLRKKQSV